MHPMIIEQVYVLKADTYTGGRLSITTECRGVNKKLKSFQDVEDTSFFVMLYSLVS
jgi:hypothetical protein